MIERFVESAFIERLTFENNVATVYFLRGGAKELSMTKEKFEEFASSESVGAYYQNLVRKPVYIPGSWREVKEKMFPVVTEIKNE